MSWNGDVFFGKFESPVGKWCISLRLDESDRLRGIFRNESRHILRCVSL